MPDLPLPPVPADCDLTGFQFMPLDVQRLTRSDLARRETPEACWAAVLLWCESWHQVPAASLPDDEAVLASLAGYGRDLKHWAKVRAGALRGWLQCQGGRLYHPVVAEKALEAWLEKLAQRLSSGEGNAKRWPNSPPFDRGPIERQMAATRTLLAALNPQSRSLTKKRTSGILVMPVQDADEIPDPSRRDPIRQGHRQGQGPSTTPTPPPADPEVVEDGPVLRFIQSRGGYMHHMGDDRRPGWLADIEGLTLEQIGEVFTWSKARGQIVVYPGKGPGYFGGALAAMREAQRAEATKQRLRMEAEANRAIHEQEASQKTKQAAAIDARNRSLVSGILATYDESPARWSSVITEAQAKLLNDLRAAYDAGRPLVLLVRHLEGMPRDLVEAGTARGREMHEQTEGTTA